MTTHATSFESTFAADVHRFLQMQPRQLPSHYLYDALGSALFDAICELPEYYPTRTEIAILEAASAEIAELLGAHRRERARYAAFRACVHRG